jgi:light-harvesting protein B-800-850 alpha chain
MNQGRIWCVVKPTVGLPLFLGAVLVIALLVHLAVLLNTDWFAGYWQGGRKAKAQASVVTPAAPGPVAVAPIAK